MSLVIGVVFSLFGGLLVLAGMRSLVTAVSVYQSNAVPVRKVPQSDGSVEFDGQAAATEEQGAFTAPFSGEDALCCKIWMEVQSRYRTDAESLEVGGTQGPKKYKNTDQSWGLAESDEIKRPFAVQEGGGRVAVDPAAADLDITGHMGETVLSIDSGESLPEAVRERLGALEELETEFDCSPDTWDKKDDSAKYREARLEPGEQVHVADATVEDRPEAWGSAVDATVGASTEGHYMISEGTESSVIRKHFVGFASGVVVGVAILAIGLRALSATGLF